MIDFTNIYTNDTSTRHWYKVDANAATIITLVTALKKERDKNSPKFLKNPIATSNGRPGLYIWKFENVGRFKTVGGIKHVLCTKHDHKDNGNRGIYMPFSHDHSRWKGNRKNAKSTDKRKASNANPAYNAAPTKPSLSKTFKADLASKVHMSNQEADFLVNEAEKVSAMFSLRKG